MVEYTLEPFVDKQFNAKFTGAVVFESSNRCLLFEKHGHIVLCRPSVIEILREQRVPQQMLHVFLQRGFVRAENVKISFGERTPLAAPEFFMIDMTDGCCMKCKYCLRNIEKKPESISTDVLTDICQYITNYCNEEKPSHISVQPWGGEPLLEFDKIIYIYNLIKPETTKVHYSVETNGVLLSTKIIEEFEKRKIGLSVSLDGTEQLHDNQRVMWDGKGSFKLIAQNIKELKVKYGDKFGNITTLTQQNAPYIEEILEFYLYELGLSHVKFNFVHNSDFSDSKDLCLNEDDIARTEKRLLDKLIQLHEDGRYIMDENILTKLKNILFCSSSDICLSKGCQGGYKMIVFDMEGRIYPCELTDHPEESIGSIYDGRSLKQIIEEGIHKSSFFAEKKDERCKGCLWHCYCRGGCTVHVKSIGKHGIDPIECAVNRTLYPELVRLILEKPHIVNHFLGSDVLDLE